jgi:Tectonin domain
MQEVWGIGPAGDVFNFHNGNWHISNPGMKLKQITIGLNGEVWGIGPAGDVFNFHNGNWRIPNHGIKLKQISIGPNGEVWGIGPAEDVFDFHNGNWRIPNPGMKLKQITIGLNGEVWGIGPAGDVFNFHNGAWNISNSGMKFEYILSGLPHNFVIDLQNQITQLEEQNQQSQEQIAQLQQCQQQITQAQTENQELQQRINQLLHPRSKFKWSYQLSSYQKAAIFSALVCTAAMLYQDGTGIFEDDPLRLTGKSLLVLCCCYLIASLFDQLSKFSAQTVEVLSEIRRRSGLMSNAFIEVIVNSADLLIALRNSTNTVGSVVEQLGNSTDKAIVELQDQVTQSLVQLRGNASSITSAINDGITRGRFRPEAHANVHFDIHNFHDFKPGVFNF